MNASDVTGDTDKTIEVETAKAAIVAVITAGNYSWKNESYTLTVTKVDNINEPSATDNGSATVTFTVTKGGTTSDEKTLTLVINKADDVTG